ncbi:MAG: pyrroline-5-carboxylate reductase [Gammaproteobacteria bacterium]|nr:pyrroline-5-carboxylate reductase [Gammaproteobacteria bacterium]
MNKSSIAFIGAGNMAGSLIGGLVQKGWQKNSLYISDPSVEQRQRLVNEYGVNECEGNSQAVSQADVLVLAVKPQVMKIVLEDIKGAVAKKPILIISIAAGIPMATFSSVLGDSAAVVRCMPNTPSLVGVGATGMIASSTVSDSQKALAEQVLGAVGIALWVSSEAQIDAVTALSGSGPAYFFLLMESMIAAGESLGLDAETAKQLTLQTALGAATMAQQSDVSPATLRQRVTSPGGTTEQALQTFEKGGFQSLVGAALNAADKRSKELAELT